MSVAFFQKTDANLGASTQKNEYTTCVLFCKDGLNQKNPSHILTEPHGPTCQEAHV